MSKMKPCLLESKPAVGPRGANSRESSDHSMVAWRAIQSAQALQRLLIGRFSPHECKRTFEDRQDRVGAGQRGKREYPAAMMADIAALPGGRIMIRTVVMDVQENRSPVRFRQGVQDRNMVRMRKGQRRTENAERIHGGNQRCHPNPHASALPIQHREIAPPRRRSYTDSGAEETGPAAPLTCVSAPRRRRVAPRPQRGLR